jgi:hypothetical protein
MSGPITVIVTANPAAALLGAAAIAAANAIQEGYARAADVHEQNRSAAESNREKQADARAQGQAELESEAVRAEAGLKQMMDLAGQLDISGQLKISPPARPVGHDPLALGVYIRGLDHLAEELKSILLTEAARQQRDLNDLPEGLVVSEAIMQSGRTLGVSARLLARIAHLGSIPDDLAALARELDDALPGQRADLLATELRGRIQALAEAAQQNLLSEATGVIVMHSLKDLGYQVEDVANTLFVEGGVMHFRRSGWGDYQIRMRVDAKSATMNFNVIRAVDAGNNERSVLDHLAEDRWCAEFPALLKSLEAYGVNLNVTRRLAAGELPVQLVAREKLPRFAAEEAGAAGNRLLAREIK